VETSSGTEVLADRLLDDTFYDLLQPIAQQNPPLRHVLEEYVAIFNASVWVAKYYTAEVFEDGAQRLAMLVEHGHSFECVCALIVYMFGQLQILFEYELDPNPVMPTLPPCACPLGRPH